MRNFQLRCFCEGHHNSTRADKSSLPSKMGVVDNRGKKFTQKYIPYRFQLYRIATNLVLKPYICTLYYQWSTKTYQKRLPRVVFTQSSPNFIAGSITGPCNMRCTFIGPKRNQVLLFSIFLHPK